MYEMKIFDLKRIIELQSTEFYLRTVEIWGKLWTLIYCFVPYAHSWEKYWCFIGNNKLKQFFFQFIFALISRLKDFFFLCANVVRQMFLRKWNSHIKAMISIFFISVLHSPLAIDIIWKYTLPWCQSKVVCILGSGVELIVKYTFYPVLPRLIFWR